MAEVNNPIKTSDLIQNDGTIDKLIADLEKLRDKYVKSMDEIRKKANALDQTLQKLSGSTEQQKQAAQQSAAEADRMSRAYKEMKKQLSEIQQELERLKKSQQDSTKQTQQQTQSTKAEARAFDELGIKLIAASDELRKATVRLNELNKATDNGRKATNAENAERSNLVRTIQAQRNSINTLNVEMRNQTKQSASAVGSIANVRAELNRLYLAYDNMSKARREGIVGQDTLKSIEKLRTELAELEAQTGRFQRNVGNYASGFSPLQFQVQQVARELPSLTMSAQQFFLAISNNLPMLADELSRARQEYRKMRDEGKEGIPVWKQLLKSVASWQTLLVVGITVVTAYGKEIGNFVKELFSGKQAFDSAAKSQEIFNKAIADGTRDAQKDIVHLDGLYNAVTNVSLGMDKRRIALKKLKDEYPDYLKGMSDEQVLAGKAVETYEKLRVKLLELAKARAAEKMLEQNQGDLLVLEQAGSALDNYRIALSEYNVAYSRAEKSAEGKGVITYTLSEESQNFEKAKSNLRRFRKELVAELSRLDAGDLWEQIKTDYNGDVNEFIKTIEASNKKLSEAAQSLYTTVEPGTTDGGTKGNGGKETSGMTPEQKANALSLKLQKEFEQSRIDQMQESAAKRRAKIENDAEWEINELTQKYAKMEGIEKEGSEVFEQYWSQIENIERKKTEDLVQLDLDYAIETRQILQDNLDARLKYIQSGSEEEYRLRLESLRNMAELDKLQARKEGKLTLDRELNIDMNTTYSEGQSAIDMTQSMFGRGMERNDKSYALQMSRIDASSMTERDKYVAQLNAEKAYWEERLRLAREYGGLLTAEDLEIAQNTIKAIEIETEKAKKPRDLWDAMGINLDDDKKQAISESVSFALEQMTAILDAEIEMAQQAVDAANERVTAAQSALDAEMQAKANGLAYSQTEAEKRLEMEKQNQAKAIAEQKKAQKQKAQIETLQQISSLVTASAAIWGALVLPWLAIPAIAIMWATFGAAKIKASQLAKSSGTEQYGDGTYEFIDGGSHQSGNDVPLGINPRTGKERRVEGGEMFAVVNKSGVRKYRSELPTIINSLNRGEFDRTYIRQAFAQQPAEVIVNASSDNRKIAADIAAIRRLSERQVYTDSKGRTVIRYKKHTKILN
ncbi:hypothetical protein [uncultured Alistipes sp.]|uniref:hypothetical protein n=1 Tax=uncultured Alistipes sp. TaxID=538949 RepID=UPI00259314D6|nr:hypothetical protein [uncultured Alistipes sp.]